MEKIKTVPLGVLCDNFHIAMIASNVMVNHKITIATETASINLLPKISTLLTRRVCGALGDIPCRNQKRLKRARFEGQLARASVRNTRLLKPGTP